MELDKKQKKLLSKKIKMLNKHFSLRFKELIQLIFETDEVQLEDIDLLIEREPKAVNVIKNLRKQQEQERVREAVNAVVNDNRPLQQQLLTKARERLLLMRSKVQELRLKEPDVILPDDVDLTDEDLARIAAAAKAKRDAAIKRYETTIAKDEELINIIMNVKLEGEKKKQGRPSKEELQKRAVEEFIDVG